MVANLRRRSRHKPVANYLRLKSHAFISSVPLFYSRFFIHTPQAHSVPLPHHHPFLSLTVRFFPPFPSPHHHPFLSLTKKNLQRLNAKGVLWKPPEMEDSSSSSPSSLDLRSVVFRLSHGGEVSSDGNFLFTASPKAMGCEEMDLKELRRRTVARFLEDFGSVSFEERDAICEFRICGVFKKLLPLVSKKNK